MTFYSCAHYRVITVNSRNIGDKIVSGNNSCKAPCKIKVKPKCDSTVTIIAIDRNTEIARYSQLQGCTDTSITIR